MWDIDPSEALRHQATTQDAVSWAISRNKKKSKGYQDWRVPTLAEALSVIAATDGPVRCEKCMFVTIDGEIWVESGTVHLATSTIGAIRWRQEVSLQTYLCRTATGNEQP